MGFVISTVVHLTLIVIIQGRRVVAANVLLGYPVPTVVQQVEDVVPVLGRAAIVFLSGPGVIVELVR